MDFYRPLPYNHITKSNERILLMRTEKTSSRYQWVIVACCFAMIFTVLGFGSSPRKLTMVAVPKALGLDYGPYSFTDTFRFLSTSIMNLLFGSMIQRFGPRKLIAAGFLSLIASSLVYSVAETLPVIYLGGALLGIGLTFTGTTMSGYVINLWCTKNKGTITGFVLCANGVGGAIATQLLSPIINASLFGYRDAYRLVALILAVVGTVIVLLMRNSPTNDALPGLAKKKAKGDVWEGISFQEALRKPYFYVIAACIFLTGMVLQSIVGSDANHLRSVGLDAGHVATVLSLHALTLAGSKFLIGVLFDRKGLKATLLLCDIAALVTLLLMIFVANSPAGKLMALCYAVVSAVAMPLETIMLPLITADLFGQRSYAQMLGVIVAINTAGYSFGPPLTNFIFDALGTYVPVFWAYLVLMAAITAGTMFALNSARKDRPAAQ